MRIFDIEHNILGKNSYDRLSGEEDNNLISPQLSPISKRRMQNQVGFSNEKFFRIVNVGDKSVIEIVGNKLIARKLAEESEPDKGKFQIFQSKSTDSGYFEISSSYQSSELVRMVWDFFPHRGALMQKRQKKSSRGNQNWMSGNVPGMECTYFILKAPEGTHCLINKKVDEQIVIVEKTAEVISNPFAHWKLEAIQPNLS